MDNDKLIKPLVVGMNAAATLLDCGIDTIYDLIDRRELDSYLEGIRRKITVDSIERLIERRLAARQCKLDRSQLLEKRLAAGRAQAEARRRRASTTTADPAVTA